MAPNRYTGRFAPSPTGPLHLGSLVTAVASFLDARAHQGRWLLRIEDIDPLREVPGAADLIVRQLAAHSLEWDGPICYQSRRGALYRDALARLADAGLLYACSCSRQRLHALGGRYDGACRARRYSLHNSAPAGALRICADGDGADNLRDFIQGRAFGAPCAGGDFIVLRRDGLVAYQLATAVDDAEQGITHVLRGADLFDSTPRQCYLLARLRLSPPDYGHVPLVLGTDGHKLSKQNLAPALVATDATANLHWALRWLGLDPPGELMTGKPADLLAWGTRHWSRDKIATQPRQVQKMPNRNPGKNKSV